MGERSPLIEDALELRERSPSPAKELTSRQLDVLRRVARGLTDKEIASELALSPRTVEMHVVRTLDALDCANRAEAVREATGARPPRLTVDYGKRLP